MRIVLLDIEGGARSVSRSPLMPTAVSASMCVGQLPTADKRSEWTVGTTSSGVDDYAATFTGNDSVPKMMINDTVH